MGDTSDDFKIMAEMRIFVNGYISRIIMVLCVYIDRQSQSCSKNAAFFQKRNTYWIVCYSSLLLSLRGYGRGICYVLSCPTAQYPL